MANKQNRHWRLVGAVLALGALFGFAAPSGAATLEKLLAERSALVWVEGQVLGDMVIGARGQIEFVYADAKLVKAVFDDVPGAPEWIVWNLQHAGKKNTKGKALFVVRLKALIPWDFDAEKLLVGSYRVQSTDILTDKAEWIEGTLPSDAAIDLAFAVPESELSAETLVGYDTYTATLKLAGR